MPPSRPEDDIGSLEQARKRLYEPVAPVANRPALSESDTTTLPHSWKDALIPDHLVGGKRHVRLASIFFVAAFLFFIVSLGAALYIFSVGGNSVSVDKVSVQIEGPTTIAGGDTVPLALTITNKNAVAVENATIEIGFPNGTRSADDILLAYPRYSENIGTLASGASVTRSIKAVLFGGAGQTVTLPSTFSYTAAGSNAVFVKKSSYALTIGTTPLSVTADTLTETVSGQPFTITLTVRSNATVALDNVVLMGGLPFGFVVNSSSIPISNSSFLIGKLAPGATKKVTLTGSLTGQEGEERVFHFTVGTASSARDQTIAVSYATIDAPVTLKAPFINTTLALNGDTSPNVIMNPGSHQSVTLSYTNTLSTNITNATVAVTVSGGAVDYNSIQTTNGFYRSSDHTIVFSRDTDPSLAQLAPGTSGVGTFSFSILPTGTIASPTVTFTTSVSGTRVGQTNVPELVSASATKTAKVATAITLGASALHTASQVTTSGPVPPRVGQATTYGVQWSVHNGGSPVAGGAVTTVLPSYVTYTGQTAGGGTFAYDTASRTVSWNTGDMAQGASAQGTFQVSLTPSTSQKGSSPQLTGSAAFSGYDRFAGVQVSASASAVTTETTGDPGYVPTNAVVQ